MPHKGKISSFSLSLSYSITLLNVINMLNQLSHKLLRFIVCYTNHVCTLLQLIASPVWTICSTGLKWLVNFKQLESTETKICLSVYSIAVFAIIAWLSPSLAYLNVISMLNQLHHTFLRFIVCCTNHVHTLHQLNSMQYWSKMAGNCKGIKKFSIAMWTIIICC